MLRRILIVGIGTVSLLGLLSVVHSEDILPDPPSMFDMAEHPWVGTFSHGENLTACRLNLDRKGKGLCAIAFTYSLSTKIYRVTSCTLDEFTVDIRLETTRTTEDEKWRKLYIKGRFREDQNPSYGFMTIGDHTSSWSQKFILQQEPQANWLSKKCVSSLEAAQRKELSNKAIDSEKK